MTRVVNIRRDAAEVARASAAGEYVYIGRGRGSRWGNPYSDQPGTLVEHRVASRAEALIWYEAWVRARPELMAALVQLRGKVLGFFCKPRECHGDVLVRLIGEVCP